ncbi:hypothetical protein [Escherichia albertii]|uniref:Uncharacterized protein n=1 Tax=Escherichia albertii TaxID=208962 RepID=A0AAX3MT29_ESCAL|nr:hypothetical protein [Escherichia albertii]WDB31970.1 hypothetical protein PS049_26230 [Escherichia albertii]
MNKYYLLIPLFVAFSPLASAKSAEKLKNPAKGILCAYYREGDR